MLKTPIILLVSLFSLLPCLAQDGVKMEAEEANYANCTLVRDSKYSGGKALEMTDEKEEQFLPWSSEAKTIYGKK